MSSKPPPVPSRNALRALRRLAFSSPTVLIGAVGSACGVAALSHETFNRVKLAEQIVATKRTIHSVSNGKGREHIARMCEAAERGEDFTLNANKAHKGRQIRHHSQVAFDRWSDGDDGFPSLQQSLQRLSQRPRSHSADTQSPESDSASMNAPDIETDFCRSHLSPAFRATLPPLEYRQPSRQIDRRYRTHSRASAEATHSPLYDSTVESQRNSASADRIRAATQMPLKRNSHAVYSRQTRHYVTKSPRHESSSSSSRLSQAQAVANLDGPEEPPQHQAMARVVLGQYPHMEIDSTPRNETPRERAERNVETASDPDYRSEIDTPSPHNQINAFPRSTVTNSPARDIEKSQSSPITSLAENCRDSEIGKANNYMHKSFEDDEIDRQVDQEFQQYFTVQHDHFAHSDNSIQDPSHVHPSKVETGAHLLQEFLAVTPSTPTKRRMFNHKDLQPLLERARENLAKLIRSDNESDVELPITSATELLQQLILLADRQAVLEALGRIPGKNNTNALLDEILRCVEIHTPSSLAQAEVIFYIFHHQLQWNMRALPYKKLAACLLKNEKTLDRAGYVLFPDRSERRRPAALQPAYQFKYRYAHHYLTWFCQNDTNRDSWIAEAEKVMSLAQERGVALHDRLITPVLRALVLSDQRMRAQSWLAEIERRFGMEASFQSRAVLVHGHAVAGDWIAVKRTFERLHAKGLSRLRPLGYSVLFQEALEEYLAQKPLNQAFDWVVNAMGYWGLIPTSTVSTTLIIAALREERYDLIQEWVEALRQLFPTVDVGTSTAISAFRIAQLWKQRESSCEDIERGCQAMAYGSLRDPFSTAFRGVAMQAVESHLRKCLRSATRLWGHPSPVVSVDTFANMKLTDMAAFVEDNVEKHANSHTLSLVEREALHEVLRQIKATTDLNVLFGGEVSRQRYHSPQPTSIIRFKPSPLNDDNAKNGRLPGAQMTLFEGATLPSRPELWSSVAKCYKDTWKHDTKKHHRILASIVPRLTREGRWLEGLQMLDSMYESPYVQGMRGVRFDQELLSTWLQLAVHLKAGDAIAKAIWAIVDSDVEVGTDLVLLVRIACLKRTSNKYMPEREREDVAAENVYLLKKLQHRHWIQNGMRKDIPRFAGFKPWEQRMGLGTHIK